MGEIFGAGVVVFLVAGVVLAPGRGQWFNPSQRPVLGILLTFLTIYFVLLGLWLIAGSIHDREALIGDFFAALALTFVWAMRKYSSQD